MHIALQLQCQNTSCVSMALWWASLTLCCVTLVESQQWHLKLRSSTHVGVKANTQVDEIIKITLNGQKQ